MIEIQSPIKPFSELPYGELSELGYDRDNRINKTDLLLFLNNKSSEGKLNSSFTERLLQTINLSKTSTISIEKLFNQISDFDESLKISNGDLSNQNSKGKEKLKFLSQRYQHKKLTENSFENARLSGEIIDIDLKKKIEGIKEIIIKIKNGDQEKDVIQKIGKKEKEKGENKCFEFQTLNKDANLEFILQAKNGSGNIINIGNRVYFLEGITSMKKYFVRIEIPEIFKEGEESIETEEIINAEIKMIFTLYKSNCKKFEFQTKKGEPKLRKLNTEINQDKNAVKKIKDEYGGESRIPMDNSKKENNETKKRQNKLRLTKKEKIEDEFYNRKTFEFPITKFIVEFNNERYDQIISRGLEVGLNNTIKVIPQKKSQLSSKKENKILDIEQKEIGEENKQHEHNEENEKVEHENANNQVGENEDELAVKKNELIKQNEDIELNLNEKQNNDLFYSGNQNLDLNKLNFGEYTQKHNINKESMEEEYRNITYVNQNFSFGNYNNNNVINESINKVLMEENILPLKYLPEKVNKVIVDNNIGTLPLIIGRKILSYSTGYNNANNLMGLSKVSQYKPLSLSYQNKNP